MYRLKSLKVFIPKLNYNNFANEATKTAQLPPEITAIPVDPAIAKGEKVIVDKLPPTSATVSPSDSFESIPGPQVLRQFANIIRRTPISALTVQYFMATGSQLTWAIYPALFKRLFDEFGPMVRLYGPAGGDVVILGQPEHITEIYKNEGTFPIRSALQSLEKYRLDCRKYRYTGPFLMFGPEWEKIRKNLDKPLNASIIQHQKKISEISQIFIQRLIEDRNKQQEVRHFQKTLQKWCMDCLFVVAINKKFGFLDSCGLSTTSDPGILLESLIGATKALQSCEKWGFHVWKMIRTPAWNSLLKHCDSLDWILGKYIQNAQNNLNTKKINDISNLSLLEAMLLSKTGIMAEDALTILLDLILVGVNATTHTISFLLYHLAKFPRSQQKLYERLKQNDLTYLKACLRESLRLKPPYPIVGRILMSDVIVNNYQIPKNTHVLMLTNVNNMKEEFYEDSHKFKPERWLEKTDETDLFTTIPFGYGTKAAIAKELTETEIAVLVSKIVDKFRIEYYYGDIHSKNRFLAEADREFKFRFVVR